MRLRNSETYIKKHDDENDKNAYTQLDQIRIDNDVHTTVLIVMQGVCCNSEIYDTQTTQNSQI